MSPPSSQITLADAVEKVRIKIEHTPPAATFCAPEFTAADLRQVYELVRNEPLDPHNFNRRVTGVEGFPVATGGRTSRQGGHPAVLHHHEPAHLPRPRLPEPDSTRTS